MAEHVIFCWSGTGNSLNDARSIASALGTGAVIRPMGGEVPKEARTIGFVFPTYYWTAPAPVAEFIRRADLPSGAYYYAVATCGVIAVNALADVDALLREKGAALSYHAKHSHVANYITVYPLFKSPSKWVPRAAETIKPIAADIAAGRRIAPPRRAVPGAVQRAFHAATSWGNFGLAYDKGYRVSGACTSCGLCERVCPVGNIGIKDEKPSFRHNCAHCMACIQYCPAKAIDYKNATQRRERYHHPAIPAAALAELNGR